MSTTVKYNGSTIATINNSTKTLKTAGKLMESDVELTDVTGGATVISVVDEQDEHGGTIRHINGVSLEGDTVTAEHLEYGYTAHDAGGNAITGELIPGGQPNLQAKTNIDPTESSQTITQDQGYDGLSSVQINAIPSNYVGSGITQRASVDLEASGATVTAPAGYYATAASKSISSGSATAPASISGSSATISTGTNTLTLTKTVSVTPSVTAGYISSGTAGDSSVSLTVSVPTKASTTYHPSTSDRTIASGTYTTGAQTIKAVTLSNLTADNIKSGVVVKVGDSTDDDCVTAVTGTYTGGGGDAKNIQYYMGRSEISSTAYTATSLSIKVNKAGSYKCYWVMDRNTTSGTSGSQLYKNGSAVGSAHTTWTYNNNNRYAVACEETLTLAQNDVLVVRCRSRSTSYICGASDLIIIEQ